MQYLISVINDTDGLATPDEDAAIDAFNDRLKADSPRHIAAPPSGSFAPKNWS